MIGKVVIQVDLDPGTDVPIWEEDVEQTPCPRMLTMVAPEV